MAEGANSELAVVLSPELAHDEARANWSAVEEGTQEEACSDTTLHQSGQSLYWYFGYGSNLNSETFLGRRGIKPLKHLRLEVPGWKLNFEIAGIPYIEPGFGSIDFVADRASDGPTDCPEDTCDNTSAEKYIQKNRQPDLQGIAYLVTEKDYRHIIATEGGDSSYRQLKLVGVDPLTDTKHEVWTLQASRPRKRCQPSLRYITIIREGARQHNFPQEYIDYLDSVEPFVLKGKRQKLGAAIWTAFWMPIITWIFAMRTLLTKPDGTAPKWLSDFMSIIFQTSWYIHDNFWAQKFGRGDHNRSKHKRGEKGSMLA